MFLQDKIDEPITIDCAGCRSLVINWLIYDTFNTDPVDKQELHSNRKWSDKITFSNKLKFIIGRIAPIDCTYLNLDFAAS